jgi:hypothetical protein
LRLYQIKMADGEMVSDFAADVWQGPEGKLQTSGIWEGLVPYAREDVEIQAKGMDLSPLEWLRRRLQCCSMVRTEVVD